jgi:cation diffusion facilitator family transporter
MDEKSLLFRKGERAAKLFAVALLALSVSKGIVAVISGSVALLADSIHSFADIFSSLAVWAGLKLVQKKPTERFPYGYYKAETFALLIVAITIASSGFLILIEAFGRLFAPAVILFPSIVLIVAAFSGIVSYLLSRYKKKIGNVIGSQALVGEGQHSLVDVYTSLLVFIGVFFSSFGYLSAEVLAGLTIGVYVIKVGLWSGKDAVLVLMDACLSPQRAKEMRDIALSVSGVRGVHNVRLRKSGPISFGEMHIEVQPEIPLDKAHAISSEVEDKIKKRFRDVESITIHVGLAHKEKIKVVIPVSENRGFESRVSVHFGNVPFFAFVEIDGEQVESFRIKPNKAARLTRKKGIEAARFLVNEKVDMVLAGGMGEGPFHLLRDNIIQIYIMPPQLDIKEAIHLVKENRLERMTAPIEETETNHA